MKNTVAVGDAIKRWVVEVGRFRVVLVNQVVEDIIDSKLQLVLLEKRQDLLYSETLFDVLLGSPQHLQYCFSRNQVLGLIGSKQFAEVVEDGVVDDVHAGKVATNGHPKMTVSNNVVAVL